MGDLRCSLFWALVDKGKSSARTIVIATRIKNLYVVSIVLLRMWFSKRRAGTSRSLFNGVENVDGGGWRLSRCCHGSLALGHRIAEGSLILNGLIYFCKIVSSVKCTEQK